MTAKEYLSRAYWLDKKINSKLNQIKYLEDLATKCTSIITDTPQKSNSSDSKIDNAVAKIVDLQSEINADIDKLIDAKREIAETINAVENDEYQAILEKRYLCFMKWEDIALEMKYSIHHLYKLHNRALNKISRILKEDS